LEKVYKPCPHCGSIELEGAHCIEYIADTYAPYWVIECKKCPASMSVDGETDDALFEAWNRRT
jgi:Lar family restriction alleviation protein